jgi:anti-anti-sigma factor
VQIVNDERNGVLQLAGELGIDVVEQLHTVLRDFVHTATRPTIDLTQVDTCDSAALQLLCSARKTAECEGKPFELLGLSAAIVETSAALGLSLSSCLKKHDGDAPEDGTHASPAGGAPDAI